MGGTLSFDWTNTETMLQAMVDVGLQATEIDTYFSDHVVNTNGLDYPSCALKPIGDALTPLGEAFTWTRKRYQSRWVDVIRTVAVSARNVDRVDQDINLSFGRYMGDLDEITALPDYHLNLEAFKVEELTDKLGEPGDGGPTMKHDPKWEVTAEGYDSTRDAINSAIDTINSLGVSLPKLPQKSLEDYIVFPLSGNYKLLQGNAEACGSCSDAMTDWALNFGRLAAQTQLAMTGKTANTFSAHLLVYGAVMGAVGKAVSTGSAVFDSIATMSEKIAVQVEKALVKLVTKLTKLMTKLASKLNWIGWIIFAKDVIERGWAAVTDIYDDIVACTEIIDACFALAEEIEAWARVMAESLEKMEQIKDMVEKLPKVDSGSGLPALPTVELPEIEKDLGEIDITGSSGSEEQDTLEDRLDELESETGAEDEEESDDEYQPDDDEVIMAPGPLGVPGEPTPQLPTA